jgi:hypothetical protein
MTKFYYAWLAIIVLEFAFLTYQDWKLKGKLGSPPWYWEIAGMTLASVGFGLRLIISPYLNPEWRLNLAFIFNTATFACFIISRHLMNSSFDYMYTHKRAWERQKASERMSAKIKPVNHDPE